MSYITFRNFSHGDFKQGPIAVDRWWARWHFNSVQRLKYFAYYGDLVITCYTRKG